jgi:integral membrane protein
LRVYRTLAYITGVFLPILFAGAIYGLATQASGETWKQAAGRPTVVEVIGPLHGFLYIALVVCVGLLMIRERWNPVFALPVALAGTIPFLSFVAEHYVTLRVRARRAAPEMAAQEL